MNCPICLEDLCNSVTFPCTHVCCQRCLTESQITACPYCRGPVQPTTPSPWLDSSSSSSCSDSSSSDSSSSDNSISGNLIRNTKGSDDSRRQQLVSDASDLLGRMVEVRDNRPTIIQRCEDKIQLTKQRYAEEHAKLTLAMEKELQALETEKLKQIEEEDNCIKQQEYHNQHLQYLSDVCMSLSTKDPHMLDLALPMYKDKLEQALGKPGTMSPTKNYSDMPMLFYVYVPAGDCFASSDGVGIYYQDSVYDVNVEKNGNITQLKCYNNIIYAATRKKIFLLINGMLCPSKNEGIDFYVQDGRIIFIKKSHATTTVYANGKNLSLTFDPTGRIEGNSTGVYVRSKFGVVYCTGNGRPYIHRYHDFFMVDDKPQFYSYIDDTTVFTSRDGKSHTFPGRGTIIPTGQNTALYHYNGKGISFAI